MAELLARIAASPSKSLLALASAFIAGIALHALDERVWQPTTFAVGAALFLATGLLALRRPRTRLILLCAGLAFAGVARYDVVLAATPSPQEPPAGSGRFVGTVVEGPKNTVAGAVLVMGRVFVSETGASFIERVELRYRVPVETRIGDRIAWRCRLSRRPYDGVMSCMPSEFPIVIERPSGFSGARLLASFKDRIRAVAVTLLPEPHASVLLGLLLGDRGGIPRDLVDAFRRTGTAHVLAVSGYNVHQLVETAFVVFAFASVRRRSASMAVAATLGIFVVLTGGEASVIRAAIMGCFGLAAGLLGRRNSSLSPLAFAAAVMLCHDPALLRHDIGFRLSFAAVIGMQAFGPALFRRLGGEPDGFGSKRMFADTVAASLATMPIALSDFGVLPLAGPIVNLVIVPLVPLIMATGAAALILGSVWAPFGTLPALLSGAFAGAMVSVVDGAARVAPVLAADATAMETVVLYVWLILLRYALVAPDRGRPVASPAPPDMVVVTYAPLEPYRLQTGQQGQYDFGSTSNVSPQAKDDPPSFAAGL